MTMEKNWVRCHLDSPIGRLRLIAADEGLTGLYFPDHRHVRNGEGQDVLHHPVLDQAKKELLQYFAGERVEFETPLAPSSIRGGTEFQRQVWDALCAIPHGQTRSYGDIARSIGRPSAVRAVGAANGLNPISIFVPCHRVIGGSGSLTGYGGGLEVKRWLLALEAPQRVAFR